MHKNGSTQKKSNNWIALASALQRINGWQIFQRGMVAKENGNLLGIKQLNKGEKFKQLTSFCAKFLKDGSPRNGIEDIFDVHL